jgi:uncharacterized membrane protein YraQ (UPF0718 family)
MGGYVMNQKEIFLSIFKSKMFYISIGLLLLLGILDLLGIKIGVSTVDSDALLFTNAISSATYQFLTMLKIVPPIFLLIGLLDIWVPRETMIKLMGEKSGVIGILIAFFIGSMSAGPLIAAFPVAQIMLKKGARYSNVLFFLTIWASAKLPILFFQATTLGPAYTLVSNITLIIVYLIGTILIEKALSLEDKKQIYALAENS